MEQFFTSLSKRQTMLLLTSLAFGGSEAIEAYDHLPIDEEELLKHRAQALVQIPRDKRVPLLVQEIKRLVMQRRRQLATVDPKRLGALLKLERPALVETVLRAVPVELADAVRAELGNPTAPRLRRDVKPEILSIIRWKLEDAMRSGPQIGGFRFTDLLTLQQRDIFAVADRMGARVLATAVAGLSEADRTTFFAQLPPDQRSLAIRAAEVGAARRLTEKDAKIVLEMHGAIESPSIGLRSAGVQRIARAALAQGPDFAQQMVARHQGDLGKLLQRWVREERPKPVKGDGGRLDIVEQLERLAQKGVIDRPMRLPPPIRPAAPVAPPPRPQRAPTPAGGAPARPAAAGKLLVPPPVRRTGGAPVAAQPPPAKPAGPRPDPIADREARRAGVGRRAPPQMTESQLRQRVLRDGKPLERDSSVSQQSLPPRPERKPASPLQQLPRRKDPSERKSRPGTAKSPVLKVGEKPPGRGPGGGSR